MRKRDQDRFDRLTTAIIALTDELRREHGPDPAFVDAVNERLQDEGFQNVIPITKKGCQGKGGCSCRGPENAS